MEFAGWLVGYFGPCLCTDSCFRPKSGFISGRGGNRIPVASDFPA